MTDHTPTPDAKPGGGKTDQATQETNLKQHAAEQATILAVARQAGQLALELITAIDPDAEPAEDKGIIKWKSAIVELDPRIDPAGEHPAYGQIYVDFRAVPGPRRWLGLRPPRAGRVSHGEPRRVGIHWWTSNDGSESHPYHSTQEWDGSIHGRLLDAELTLGVLQAVNARLQTETDPQ